MNRAESHAPGASSSSSSLRIISKRDVGTALAEYVAEPTAGNKTNREGECIAGDDKLGLRETRAERAPNARNSYVDDRVVHDREENAREHHQQCNLTPRVKPEGRPGSIETAATHVLADDFRRLGPNP